MKNFIFLVLLVSSNIFCYSQTCDQININVNPINIYEVKLNTTYDSLVNLNPNSAAVSAIYDWRAYPPGNHNLSDNTHFWHSTKATPTFESNFSFNDSYFFFILSLKMEDTTSSTIPLTTCILPFFIARDTLLPTYWNLTMLNSNTTDMKIFETCEKKLINTYNLAGQIVDPNKVNQEIVIYKYLDGSTEKKFINK